MSKFLLEVRTLCQQGRRVLASRLMGGEERSVLRARLGQRSSERLSAVAPALLVALPALFAVIGAVVRASWTSLGRDQGIFQYVAWAVGQGDVAYRDVRDVNGPVVVMVHAVFQALGGTDEHRFRVLDLLVNGLTFASAGACLPSLSRERPTPLARLAWALAAWAALTAQYVIYGFWDTAQRESFLDWFVLGGMALGFLKAEGRTAFLVTALSGAASVIPAFGKPTYLLFTAAQIVAVLLEPDRRRRLAAFAAGGLAGALVPLGYLFARGDPRAWARITLVDVPTMYRFIWPSPASDIVRLPGYGMVVALAVATSAILCGLVVLGRLPRRAIPAAVMPVLGCISVFVQAKGFPYHFHPVTLGTTFGWLVALAGLWTSEPERRWWRGAIAVLSLAAGVHAMRLAERSPDPEPPPKEARDLASLESAARLGAFERIDFFPKALRDAAAYVAARTSPTDRVQMYGMDAYFLFLAGRRSATPYVYAYDLNVDAALYGSVSPDGLRPTASQASLIRAIKDAHESDLLARLERAPPAAFVFVDRSPLMSSADAIGDFGAHCPTAASWTGRHYRETAVFGPVHVWLRRRDRPE
jgi:hypothetical protein